MRLPDMEDIAGCKVSITYRGTIKLDGNAGSSFEFFPEEAKRLRDWLNAALATDTSEGKP